MRGREYSMCMVAVLCVAAAAWADPIVTLNPSQSCYDPDGTVTVTVDLTGSGFPDIVGGQFFIDFDATYLSFVSASPGDPWTVEIYESVSGSRIDYAVGIADGGSGATAGTMATLTFTALQEICDAASLVSFNLDVPPGTILGDEEDNEYSLATGNLTLEDLSAVSIDSTPPTVSDCPSNITQSNDPGECSAVVTWTPPTANDNCAGVTLYSTHDPGATFPVGVTTVTYTAEDTCGNTNTAPCSFTVTVTDDEDPTITCPADVTVDADAGLCTASGVDLGTPTTDDNCSVDSVVNDASEPYALGDTTVTWTVTDGSGNTATCTQTVTVVDNQDPTITCPADVMAYADAGLCTASGVDLGTPTADDNCSVASVVNDASEPYALGDTTVTWTVTDGSGNTATCTQTVTVVDDQDPTITCPADVTVYADAGLCTASGVDLGTPTTDDNCSVDSVVNDASGPYALGDTTVTWTVTDGSGNTATCTQTVTVVDDQDPTITCPADVMAYADAGLCTASGVDLGTPTADDNCSVDSVVNDASEPYALGDTVVTWTVTDGSGNTATCTQTVTVVDDQDPTITCPADVTAYADAGLCTASGVDLGTPTADDNCSVDSVVNDASEPYALGDTTVTWTVTDGSGNTATCTQTVAVLAYNELLVDVALAGSFDATFDRCITFELYDTSECTHVEVEEVVEFVDGQSAEVSLLVPCGFYDCIRARDGEHTLWTTNTDDFGISGGQYLASFTDKTPTGDDDQLIVGNLNAGEYIDIMDYVIYINHWGMSFPVDLDCDYAGYHPDFNGDGLVDSLDFDWISFNFLVEDEANCCGLKVSSHAGPRLEISVAELIELGMEDFVGADLTGDGWVDTDDIDAFLNGELPDDGSSGSEQIDPSNLEHSGPEPSQPAPVDPRP